LKEKFTPEMAAFLNWMVIRHPDEFMLAEEEDKDFGELYRQGLVILDRQAAIVMVRAPSSRQPSAASHRLTSAA
jgi:hypothetical protein